MSRPLVRRTAIALSVVLVLGLLAGAYFWQERAARLAAAAPLSTPAALKTIVPAALTAPAFSLSRGPQLFQELSPEEARRINGETPFSTEPIIAAKPFVFKADSKLSAARALTCLTQAVYYEAATESLPGRRAVAQVVLNRVRSPEYPKTICGVVFEGAELATGCQFTFTCDGSLARTPEPKLWKEAEEIAQQALNGYVMREVGLATHYHTDWVVPYWMSSLVKLKQLGAHIFYRWPGGPGSPQGFGGVYAGVEPPGMLLRPLEMASLETPAPAAAPQIEPAVERAPPPSAGSTADEAAGGAGSASPAAAPLVRPPATQPSPPGFEKSETWTPQPSWRRF